MEIIDKEITQLMLLYDYYSTNHHAAPEYLIVKDGEPHAISPALP